MRGTDPTKSKWVCPTNNLHLIRFALHAYIKYDRVVVRCKLILLFFLIINNYLLFFFCL